MAYEVLYTSCLWIWLDVPHLIQRRLELAKSACCAANQCDNTDDGAKHTGRTVLPGIFHHRLNLGGRALANKSLDLALNLMLNGFTSKHQTYNADNDQQQRRD